MSDTAPSTSSRHRQMIFGYMPAQIIHVAARLAIADHLTHGPRTSAELADATGTHAPSLHRLLRALACLGLLRELEPGRFELTDDGLQLCTEAPNSMRRLAMLFCGDEVWRAWGELEYCVRTGDSAWQRVTGTTPFEFLAEHPDQAETFNAAMSEATRQMIPGLLAGFDFTRFTTLADLGGGDGTLIAAILKAVPTLHGVLFDLPAGLDAAAKTLDAAGVAARCRIVAGDFFDAVPAGADGYLLKSVIHDWDDERAIAILRSCRRAMGVAATLLVLEPVLPTTIDSTAAAGTVFSDINMLVNTGGRERTEAEFRSLFAAAGFDLTAVTGPLHGSDYRMLEGVPR